MKKKILITGASGFVGACLTRKLLDENHEVHIIARKESNLWRLDDVLNDLHIHNTDLMNSDDVSKLAGNTNAELVYHLATYGGYYFQKDLNCIIRTNLIGTWNLFQEFSKKGIALFVHTSSSSEYGEKAEPMREDMKVAPTDMYGASKASATILCSTYAKMHQTPFITLRLFSPYGYYDAPTRLIPTVISSCLSGLEIKLTQKDAKRDYIFIEDVIDAYLACSKLTNAYGEVFNIGSGKQYTVEQITNKIITMTGSGAQIDWGNHFGRQYEPAMWVSDSSKAGNILNWRPRTDINEGLQKTIGWFENHLQYYQ